MLVINGDNWLGKTFIWDYLKKFSKGDLLRFWLNSRCHHITDLWENCQIEIKIDLADLQKIVLSEHFRPWTVIRKSWSVPDYSLTVKKC